MHLRRLTAVLTTAAVATGAAVGVAQAQSSSQGQDNSARPAHKGPGGKPGRGFGGAQLKALAAKLGVTTTQLKAALDAIRPAGGAGPDRGDRPNAGGGLAGDLAKALGVDTAKVQAILDANRPTRSGRGIPAAGSRPAKPDHNALISALASGLDIDEATVKAAFDKLEATHRADHKARDAAFAAALAKQLGLETDDVQAALDATRPAKPRR